MRRRCAQLCSGLRCHELSPLTFRPRYRPLPLLLQPSCRRATLFNYTGDQRAGTQVATAPADAFNAHRMRSSASSRAFSRSLVNDAPTNSTDTLPLSLSLCVCLYGEEFSTSVSTLAKLCLPGKRLRDGLIFVIALGASRMDGAEECRGMKGIIGIRLFSKRVFERGDSCLDYVNGVPKFTRCNFDRKHTGL